MSSEMFPGDIVNVVTLNSFEKAQVKCALGGRVAPGNRVGGGGGFLYPQVPGNLTVQVKYPFHH